MKFRSVDQMLYATYRDCLTQPQVNPRGDATRERLAWSGCLLDPKRRLLANPIRDVRKGYAAAKLVWDLLGMSDIETLAFFNPNAVWYDVYGMAVGENYGHRFYQYLDEAIELVRLDKHTRRAFVPVWKPHDLIDGADRPSRSGVSTPCCIGFQLFVRNHKLNMQVMMRSQSIGVMPYDVFLFSALQELVANTLEFQLGVLNWHANSLHVYDKELDRRIAEHAWWKQNGVSMGTMQPIPYTLREARARWVKLLPTAMDATSCTALVDSRALDPIEELVVNDALRKHRELAGLV